MAGTLTISTLSDGTNSTSSTNCIQGSAKAWVNFNGQSGSVAVNASYNVSSITRNGSGSYTVTLTNALADNKYAIAGSASSLGSGGILAYINDNNTLRTSSAFIFQVLNSSLSSTDSQIISCVVFR